MSDGLPTIAELVDRLRSRQERIAELEAEVARLRADAAQREALFERSMDRMEEIHIQLDAEVARLRPLAQVGRLVVGRYIVDCLPFCHDDLEALAQDLGLIRSYEDGNGDSVVEWAPGVEDLAP